MRGRGRRKRGPRQAGAPARRTPPPALDRARRVAERVYHVPALRPEQEQALDALLAGRDALVVLPTGAGKSLLYQVPAVLSRKPTVVVSPLLALMQDQEKKMRRAGIPVRRLDSTLKAAERREALATLARGGQLLVLTTPETLGAEEVQQALRQGGVGLLAVDEAHCISEWGHDFRPAYLRLGAVRQALGGPQALAVTATATAPVRAQIEEALGLRDPVRLVAPPHRENLRLGALVLSEGDKPEQAGRLLRRLPRPGIVYCATTAAVDLLYVALGRAGLPVTHYHGRMRAADRQVQQERFMRGRRAHIMVATSAFGMGIDKPDIRFILHYQAPGSLEQYVQEAGRAGRDGRPADCMLLLSEEDLEVQARLVARSRASPRQLLRLAGALRAWAEEGRAVAVAELALSAEVPTTTAGALLASLEAVGAVGEEEGRFAARLPPQALEERARELARRLETQRTQDRRRLEAVRDYAQSEECRSLFLRRYFGEAEAPPCGQCDVCRARGLGPTPPERRRRRRRRGGRTRAPVPLAPAGRGPG